MDLKQDQRVRVFSPKQDERRERAVVANLSSYEGKAKDGSAKYASWYASFVGSAYEKAKGLRDRDEIVLTNAKIENNYNKEKERLYVVVTVFDYEVYHGRTTN